MQHRYQFRLRAAPKGPVRDTWEAAFEDARKAGYAKQLDEAEYKVDHDRGAHVVRIK